MNHDEISTPQTPDAYPAINADRYECPEVVDYGTLTELTLSGTSPLSDSAISGAS